MTDDEKIEQGDYEEDTLLEFHVGPSDEPVTEDIAPTKIIEEPSKFDHLEIHELEPTSPLDKQEELRKLEAEKDKLDILIHEFEAKRDAQKELESAQKENHDSGKKLNEGFKFPTAMQDKHEKMARMASPVEQPPVKKDDQKPKSRYASAAKTKEELEAARQKKYDEKKVPGDIKPWDIDRHGRLKSQKIKTEYELWIEKKRESEGNLVICPKCGTENIELAIVEGETCKRCGHSIEGFDNVLIKMDDRDTKLGKTSGRIEIGSTVTGLRKNLALPEKLAKDPNYNFEYTFTSSSWGLHAFFLVVSIILTGILIAYVGANGISIWSFIMIPVLVFCIISAAKGFSNCGAVNEIYVDKESVTFKGFSGTEKFEWGEINAVRNRRVVNAWARTSETTSGISPRFILAFLFLPSLWFWILLFSGQLDDRSNNSFHNRSSSSGVYTNYISIAAKNRSVEYAFAGAGNRQFVMALAIIIFMAKKHNKSVLIMPTSIEAAERGEDDFIRWRNEEGIY